MDQKTKDALSRQIGVEVEKLSTVEDGSDEKTKQISDLANLCRIMREEEAHEASIKIDCRQADRDYEASQQRDNELKLRRFDSIVGHGLNLLGIVTSLGFSYYWMNKGFKFETEGTYTSKTFQTLWSGFLKKFR